MSESYKKITNVPVATEATDDVKVFINDGDALKQIAPEALGLIGVESIEQTTQSAENGGFNIWTLTQTDGTVSKFYVRNGQAESSVWTKGTGANSVRTHGSTVENDEYVLGGNAIAGGYSAMAPGTGAVALGTYVTAGDNAFACGETAIASGGGSVAIGSEVTASNTYSLAIGTKAISDGFGSTAIGYDVYAGGDYGSFAEGNSTYSSGGSGSHAEGSNTFANAMASHAEGVGSVTNGAASHAEGRYTTAHSDDQHVQGKFNIGDSSAVYAHIVGNGTSDKARSNAHTLDWDGNAWFAGNVYVGDANQGKGSKLMTEEEVQALIDAAIAALSSNNE